MKECRKASLSFSPPQEPKSLSPQGPQILIILLKLRIGSLKIEKFYTVSKKKIGNWYLKRTWCCKWSRAKANRVMPRECTGHSKRNLPKTQEKTLHMDITRWSTPKSDWLYSLQPKMEKLYTVSKNKIQSWLWLRSWTPYCQIHPTPVLLLGKSHGWSSLVGSSPWGR